MELPEERELSQKTQELNLLETELAERELTLATLQAQVRDFEQDYLRRVGRLYAALDEVAAELAALDVLEHPGSVDFEQAAHKTRARAEHSAREAGAAPGERKKPPCQLYALVGAAAMSAPTRSARSSRRAG